MKNTTEASYSNAEIDNIINLLDKGEESIIYSSQKDITLVLGLTSSGKSTFSEFITEDDSLESEEVIVQKDTNLTSSDYEDDEPVTEEKKVKKYRIVDNKKGKIGHSLVDSKTIFPDLYMDTEKYMPFYDCPGFSDTRSAAHEISETYFIKKIIDSAKQIKLIFIVDVNDLSNSKINFALFLEHVAKMIKNIKKFEQSIALVVTKVDKYKMKPRSYIKNFIIPFLEQFKSDMVKSKNKKEFQKESIDFIDILIQNNGENTIGILKQPTKIGNLSEMDILKKNKSFLRQLIFEKRTFTWIEENDFGYTLSSKSEKQVNGLIEKISDKMALGIETIGQEIKQYYQSQERKLKDIISLSNIMRLGYDNFKSTIRDLKNEESQQLITHILRRNIDKLNITIPETSFSIIEKHIKYTTFLKKINSDKGYKTHTSYLVQKLNDLVEYLSDSQKWYSFLIDFNESLSRYEIQKNVSNDRYKEMKETLIKSIALDKEPSEQHKIIANIKNITDLDYGTVQSLDATKLKFVENILNTILSVNATNVSCTDDTLLIEGENVRLSDMSKKECPQAKFIKIFALNKVFIDTNLEKPGDKIQLSIIAPKWEVMGKQKIILDGKPGTPHTEPKAPPPPGEGTDGYDGEPGNRGIDTGSFLGIGSNFINGEDLSVSLRGGDGAPGQSGSDGTKGKDGELIEDPKFNVKFQGKCQPLISKKSFNHESFGMPGGSASGDFEYICQRDGEYCTKGGKGGKGGRGGEGGKANKELMLSLEKAPNVKFDRADGKKGVDGNPGSVGPEGRRGQFLQVARTESITGPSLLNLFKTITTYTYRIGGEHYKKINHDHCVKLETAENDSNIANIGNIDKPMKFDIFEPITAINDYKSFLRKNLHNHARETDLREFLEKLEKNKNLEDFNNTLGFVNELRSLEDQFNELHTVLPLLPFYESLLSRITNYINKIGKNGQLTGADKKALCYLYTATFSKIINIKNQSANELILDQKSYLETSMQDIKKLKDFSKIALIDDLDKNYRDEIEKQIDEAEKFVKTKITPEIKNILLQVDQDLQHLIDNAISQQNTARKEQNELLEKEDSMRKQLAMKAALGILNIGSKFLNFLGPVGSAAGVAISGGVQIMESLVIDEKIGEVTDGKMYKLPSTVKDVLPSIKTELTKRQKSLKEQLAVAHKQLKGEDSADSAVEEKEPKSEIITEIEKKISSLQTELDQGTDDEIVSYDNAIEKKQELDKFIKQKKEVLKTEKSESNIKDVLKILDRTETVLGLVAMPVDFFKKLGEDAKKIDAISSAIENAGNKLKNLQEYEKNIYRAIIPKCRFINDQMKNLSRKNRAALDISKWEIQSVLENIRDQVQKLTKEFNPQENISYLMEKLKGSLSIMINMYNLIQDYYDKQQLAHYIANINSDTALQIEIPDETLRLAVNRLNPVIQSNIVLEKFEKAMNSFRQLIYPFANEYHNNFTIPYAIQSNDTKNVVKTTVIAMEKLSDDVTSNKYDLKGYQTAIYPRVYFQAARPDVKIPMPFFVWSYDENKLAISKLLKGEEITLKSDITKGLKEHNAVKFKQVGIYFKLANQALQGAFYDQLQFFQLSMVHLGNSQYRCYDKFHIITNKNVSVEYSVGLSREDKSSQENDIYGKLSNHDAMLSPYTMWNIRLMKRLGLPKNITFDLLEKYLNEPMDLQLEGFGQYTRPGPELDLVCNDDLNKYYKVDDTVSPSENIALSYEKSNSKIESQATLPTNGQKERKRRSLNEHEWKQDVDEQLFATNGAYNSMKSSFINNIFNAIGAGLVTLEFLNPINKISQWFDKREKSIDQDFNMFDNNVPSTMKFSNSQSFSTEMPEVSNMFINDGSATINNAIYDSSICNHGNLLLLDLIIRSKSGVKHEHERFADSKNLNCEYAQSLAYREHVTQ